MSSSITVRLFGYFRNVTINLERRFPNSITVNEQMSTVVHKIKLLESKCESACHT